MLPFVTTNFLWKECGHSWYSRPAMATVESQLAPTWAFWSPASCRMEAKEQRKQKSGKKQPWREGSLAAPSLLLQKRGSPMPELGPCAQRHNPGPRETSWAVGLTVGTNGRTLLPSSRPPYLPSGEKDTLCTEPLKWKWCSTDLQTRLTSSASPPAGRQRSPPRSYPRGHPRYIAREKQRKVFLTSTVRSQD